VYCQAGGMVTDCSIMRGAGGDELGLHGRALGAKWLSVWTKISLPAVW